MTCPEGSTRWPGSWSVCTPLDPGSLQLPEVDRIEDPCQAVIPYLPSTEAGRHVNEVLASSAFEQGHDRCVLLHGDYWPGNVLWQDGRLVAVIDWEDACFGDPLADLATARVELLCRYDDDAMEQFTNRYLAMHRDTIGALPLDWLCLWELYVSAAALAAMGDWGLEPAEEAQRRQRTRALLRPGRPTTRLTVSSGRTSCRR